MFEVSAAIGRNSYVVPRSSSAGSQMLIGAVDSDIDQTLMNPRADTTGVPVEAGTADVLATPLAQTLRRIWESDSDRLDERLEILGDAVAALGDGALTTHVRADAERAAHMIADTAGTFGLSQASQDAHVLELELEHARPADGQWLSAVFGELRHALDRA